MSPNPGPSKKELEEWMQIYKKLKAKEQEQQDWAKIDKEARKKAEEYWKYKQEKEAKGGDPMDFKDWLDYIKPTTYDP